MVENSKIEWTDHTFNPWIGCTKISPGCNNCYAAALANRHGWAKFEAGQPRYLTKDANWHAPMVWNARAAKKGIRYRVFCASLADVFDNEVPEEWRVRLWKLVYDTPNLDWLVLTKRIGNARHMLPLGHFRDGVLPNLWLGATIVNQEEADRDIPKLLDTPAHIRFLSMEPLLGAVDLTCIDKDKYGHYNALSGRCVPTIDWVIAGGESGSGARPVHPDWILSLRDQCTKNGVPFFFKQWGDWLPFQQGAGYMNSKILTAQIVTPDGLPPNRNGHPVYQVGKRAAGRLLDGLEWNQLPKFEGIKA